MNTEEKTEQVKENDRLTEIDDASNFLRKILLGSSLTGIILWPFVPVLSSLIISMAPVVLCFYFIKDSTVKYQNNLLFLTGSFAGYIAIFATIVQLRPSNKVKVEFQGTGEQKAKTFSAGDLMVTSLSRSDKRDLASIEKISIETSLERHICNNKSNFLCKIIPFKFENGNLEIKTLTGDFHEQRDLMIETHNGNEVRVLEQADNINEAEKVKVGVLENEDLSSNGFLNIKSSDDAAIVKTLNDLGAEGELDYPALKAIRNACTPYPKEFCRFPIQGVVAQETKDNSPGQAVFCNTNKNFQGYEGNIIELSLIKETGERLVSSIPLRLTPMYKDEKSREYISVCTGKNKDKLVRISPADLNKMFAGIPNNKCNKIERIDNNVDKYSAFAVIAPHGDIQLSEEDSKRDIPPRKCV